MGHVLGNRCRELQQENTRLKNQCRELREDHARLKRQVGIVLRQLAAVQTVVYNLNIDVSVQRLDLNARDLRKYPYRVAGEKCKWTMRF